MLDALFILRGDKIRRGVRYCIGREDKIRRGVRYWIL